MSRNRKQLAVKELTFSPEYGGTMPRSSQQHHQIDPGSNNWLAALIDSFEDVARAGESASCDPSLVLAVKAYLARPVSQKSTAGRRSSRETTLA
jgi:hypothetical protein